jgi:cysteine desulfurase family protein
MDIYFDNAATSWPKPRSVIDAMNRFNEFTGSNPGRSGHHRSVEAGRVIFKTRDALAELFGISDPLRIVLTYNITHSLNIVLQGILQRGDHVITTSMEHNSVMRPLRDLETKGVEVTVINCDHHGALDSSKIPECIKKSTKLIVTTHASNVTGTVFPIKEIGKIASEHGIPYCVDAAQTAGVLEIDVKEFNIDLLCFTGHKSLYGPMGTGGLYIRKGLEEKIRPLTVGGTGSRSEFEVQPDFMPDKYESGTLNAIGIAGLYEGLMFIKDTGIKKIHEKENLLIKRFISGVSGINEIHLYGPDSDAERVAVWSFNI